LSPLRGELDRAPTPQPPLVAGVNTAIEALGELRLSAPEACAPERDRALDFDFRKLEHQLAVYLGPRLSREDLRALAFSLVGIMRRLAGGKPLSPGGVPGAPQRTLRSG
jgi:hypothetical protein